MLAPQGRHETGLVVLASPDPQHAQEGQGLGWERREGPSQDLVVVGALDLERQGEPAAHEPALFVDAGRRQHVLGVLPHRHEDRLDRPVAAVGLRDDPRADDEALQPADAAGRRGDPVAHVRQGVGIVAGEQAAEDDAQDHRARV